MYLLKFVKELLRWNRLYVPPLQAFVNACRGDYGGGDYRDIMAAVDYAMHQYSFIDEQRLGVTGGSYGGFMYSTIEKYRVTIWYSAPTAFRRLMAVGDELIQKYDLSSLRHILSVGEPLNAEVIHWGRKVYGLRCRS